MKKLTLRQASSQAWRDANGGITLTPLLAAIHESLKNEIPPRDRDVKDLAGLWKIAGRISKPSPDRGEHHCLGYVKSWKGEFYVSNFDLLAFARFTGWLFHLAGADAAILVTGRIAESLRVKRLQQAHDRFKATGLLVDHCRVLSKMSWNVDTQRGNVTTLYVPSLPFGTTNVVLEVYQHTQWPIEFGDVGPRAEHAERAWNLLDELVFAVRDAVMEAFDVVSKPKE